MIIKHQDQAQFDGDNEMLILASQSKSRLDMLRRAGVAVTAVPSLFDEDSVKLAMRENGANARIIADTLAEQKAIKISMKNPDNLVLGADQILALDDGTMLSKAADPNEAIAQLKMMSGKIHRLISAAVICEGGKPVWRNIDVAKMDMRILSDDFITDYIAAYWDDIRYNVGCYAIEDVGAQLFRKIDGSLFTVMGLPLLAILDYCRIRGLLKS